MKANQRFSKWLVLPIFLTAIVSSGHVYAVNATSVQSGDWENTATWNCGCVPGAADNITISTGTTVRVNGTHHTGNVTVNGTLDTYNQYFEFEGTTFTNNGSIISSTATDGEIDFNGVGAVAGTTQTIAGTGPYAGGTSFVVDIHIVNNTTVTPAAGTVIGGVTPFLIAGGSTLSLPNTFVFKNGTMTNNGAISGAGTLQTQGPVTLSFPGSTTTPFEAVSGVTTASGNFGRVTIDNGATLSQSGTLTANGNVTVVSGGILDMQNRFLEFQGITFTNNGSIISSTATDGEIDFNGVAGSAGTTQTIAGTGTYAGGTSFVIDIHIINNTTVTPAAGTVIGGVTPLLLASGSTLSLPNTFVFKNGTIINGGTISGTGLLQTQGPVTFNSSGNTMVALEMVSGTTTGSGNFGQATIDPGATLLQNGTITENGNFVVNGTLDTNQFFEFQGATFTNNGSIIDTTDSYGEIDFIGVGGVASTTQAIAGTGVYAPGGSDPLEIHVLNSTTVTPAPGTVLGAVRNFFIPAGSTLSLSHTLVFKNGAINSSGTISGAGSLQTQSSVTLNFAGSTTAPLEVFNGTTTGSGNFGQVTIDNGATLFESNNVIPNGNLTVASGGTVDMNNQYLFFQGATFANNGALISSFGFGELDFKGVGGVASTTQNVAGTGTYNTNGRVDIHLVNSVTVQPASGTVINGVAFLTIDGGATLDFTGSGGLTLAADVSNSGTVRLNGGGTACGDATKILIRSNVPGTQRAWSGGGTFSLTDVDVKDQAGNAAILVTGGIDSGNNGSNWTFATCAVPTPTPSPTPPSTPTPTPTPSATPTPTPTPSPTPLTISGTISYCTNPVPGPVPNVTLTLTGSASGSTLSDGSGNYQFSSVAAGGSYIVTPTKAARVPGSAGINTVDVIAVQKQFLTGTFLSGCKLAAADVNGDTVVTTQDVIAVQRFFSGFTNAIANVGKYKFTPASRSYLGITTNQTAQNYDTLVFGDVATPFADSPDGPSQTTAADGTSVSALSGRNTSADEVPATVATLSLPNVVVDTFVTNFVVPVTTTIIDAGDKLVGFQGDLSFDERMVTFPSDPVQKAGLTGGNWNVSGNVLPGEGPIRTLRISAFSNDFMPLSGSGTLFELRMTRVSQAAQGTQLTWAAPPDHFIFIDADLNTQAPGTAAPGSVTPSRKRK